VRERRRRRRRRRGGEGEVKMGKSRVKKWGKRYGRA
jgi:hypothetical protein